MASTQYTALGNYTSAWASLYSISFPPEIYQEWFQRYGEGFKILDFLRMFGRTQTTANRVFYHYEDAAEQRVVTLADNGTGDGIDIGGAGVTRTIKLAAGDFDSNNNGPLRERFTVLVPKAYQHASVAKDRWYVVTTVGAGAGVNIEYTISPLDDDARIGTAVPVGTELLIGPSYYAPGTGQPDGMATGTYRRTHRTHIVKESVGFEGGQIAQRSYREQISQAKLKNGGTGLFDKGTIETEFRLDDQIDSALFIGEENENSLTQTSQAGGTPAVTGTKGIWNWQTELAQSLSYIDDFDMEYFDQIKPLLQSQGVIDQNVLFCYGTNLGLKVENGVLEALKEWSGGSDLLKDGNKMFGVEFKTVQKNGVKFICKELASFANPNKLGNASYQFKDAGMMIPIGYASVSDSMYGTKQTVPNISICFYNHNGEDRTRIIGTVAGLNGMGYQIVDQYDRTNVYMLSEFSSFVANANQHIQITKA